MGRFTPNRRHLDRVQFVSAVIDRGTRRLAVRAPLRPGALLCRARAAGVVAVAIRVGGAFSLECKTPARVLLAIENVCTWTLATRDVGGKVYATSLCEVWTMAHFPVDEREPHRKRVWVRGLVCSLLPPFFQFACSSPEQAAPNTEPPSTGTAVTPRDSSPRAESGASAPVETSVGTQDGGFDSPIQVSPRTDGGANETVSVAGPPEPPRCEPGVPVTSQLPLLSNIEYENTVSDLLGLPLQVANGLAPDATGTLDGRAWDAYLRAARRISMDVVSRADHLRTLLPCDTEDQPCVEDFIAQFGKRAFRRPLTTNEQLRYLRLYEERATLTKDGSFVQALELIIRALLASPSFLVKGELTVNGDDPQNLPLNDWEIASRLSYALTATMPDAELFSAASADSLRTPEQILAQAKRLLHTERGRAQVSRFHRSFLQMDVGGRWTTDISRDSEVYPLFAPTQVPAMNTETSLFMDHVTYGQGSYQDLLTLPVGFVNRDLAPLYGLDSDDFADAFTLVELDPERYSGLLTRIGFLMSHSSTNRTNPITRGAFIQKFLLCMSMPPPPAGASATPLPDAAELRTNRARVDAQTADAACVYCHHNIINPVGFALENFDALGAYQTLDNGEPIDSRATVLLGDEQFEVSGAVELMQRIAQSPVAQRCYAQSWLAFAYGRLPTPQDLCTVEDTSSRMTSREYGILDLVADLTQSVQFSHRAVGPTEEAP